MVHEWEVRIMYATKRRRRSVKTVKTPMKDPPKSNPSKRHRERLNSELDHLASLLPFEQSVISKLDRLSILRLAVCYLRTKSFFQAALHERYALDHHHHHHHHHLYAEPGFTDTDSVLQALNGFLFVVTCEGEVFFASRTVEQYLGFHQSDIIHQSALELIHSEDREDFKAHLNWRAQFPADQQQDITMVEASLPENLGYLYRSFTVRFRCLLDNTSGFITLEISGHIRLLHGQSLKGTEDPEMALFAICCPFGPLPLLDVPPRDYTFKTKHKMDLAPISMDHRGKLLFGYSDHELQERGGYDLIHPEDLSYYSAAHQELIKTGSSGLIAYRLLTKDFRWLWLQTSSKVVYKNSKPDFVICTHRHLTDDEGRDLVGKRGSEFKLPYPIIDTDTSGLGSPIDEDLTKIKSPRSGKKSKTQLRDYLHTGRKRKTPYRETFNGLNGYSPYSSINGYPACQTGDVKAADLMYQYTAAGNQFGLDSADFYRTGYPFTTSMYPTAESLRLEAEKHGYANGYYLEPRQYQHTLQYHGNGYADYMTSSSKYGYDMAKYGYPDHMPPGYGLDLSKRSPYDEEIKYSHDYNSDKYSRVNGTLDPLKSSALYGTMPLQFNNESLLGGSSVSPHASTMPGSIYRPETAGLSAVDRTSYGSHDPTAGNSPKDTKVHKSESLIGSESKQSIQNGHASVIRNASPRTKSPRERSSVSSIYSEGTSVLSGSCSSSWPTCDKNTPQSHHQPSQHQQQQQSCKSSPHSASTPSDNVPSAPTHSMTHVASNLGSRIMTPMAPKVDVGSGAVSLNSMQNANSGSNSSPAAATTVTSVIQQSGRIKSCEKQTSSSSYTGGIAVPVVKSSSWLHHPLSTSSYDWPYHNAGESTTTSTPTTTTQTSGSGGEAAAAQATAVGAQPLCSRATLDGVESRAVREGAKYPTVKDGESDSPAHPMGYELSNLTTKTGINPLLTFSQVTHTLLNSN